MPTPSAKHTTAFEASHGQVISATSKLLQELGGEGKRVIMQLNNDPAYRRRVANFAKAGGYSPSTDQKRARDIMGKNFLGVEDVIKHFKVALTDDEVVQLREIPFTEGTLLECKDTHVLFPGYPFSILEIRDRVPNELFYNQDWLDNESFAKKKKVNLRWYLIRKEEVLNSTCKTWQVQQSLHISDETTPRACEVIFMVILYFLVTGKRLLERMYVRCIDFSSRGVGVCVGIFDTKGPHVNDWTGDNRSGNLGLAASRLPATPKH